MEGADRFGKSCNGEMLELSKDIRTKCEYVQFRSFTLLFRLELETSRVLSLFLGAKIAPDYTNIL